MVEVVAAMNGHDFGMRDSRLDEARDAERGRAMISLAVGSSRQALYHVHQFYPRSGLRLEGDSRLPLLTIFNLTSIMIRIVTSTVKAVQSCIYCGSFNRS